MSDVIEDRMGRVIATAFTRNVGGKLDGELISNALLARSELMSTLLDPRRDVDAECHYPTTRDVAPEQYKQLYDRDPIACRVVQCMAKESWQIQPSVFEAEDPSVHTPFEDAWDALQPMLSGSSWYKAEEAGSIWEYLQRIDVLSGIGHFGVLLMGFGDGKNLQEPVEGAMVTNTFCPTGEGGGQDSSCGKGESFNYGKVPKNAAGVAKKFGYVKILEGNPSTDLHKTSKETVWQHPKTKHEVTVGKGFWEHRDSKGKLLNESKHDSIMPHVDLYKHLQSVHTSTQNRQIISDCYLTKNEEDNLRKLPNLNRQEEAVLNQLAKQREMIVNAMQARQGIRERPQQNPVFGQTADEHDPKSMTGVSGTDKQYSQEFGLQGEADYSPGLSGTDQQYFGVQFGPTELPSKRPSKRKLNLLFLRPFDESLVQIVRYEWNINNPRFGMPVMYRITLNDPREQHSGIGLPMATVFVHWSRVLHVNDVFANEGSSEIFSPPRCRAVLNRLLDLQKIYGASAEGYWQAAFTGIALETHPQLGGDVTIDNADVRGQLENYVNSLQRYLALTGMSAHTLAPAVSDPSSQIDKHLEAICIQLSIPKRVFMGSERGELASTQDDASWNDRLKARQQGYITPRIIVPFVDRLISVGVLPEPSYVEPVEEEADEFGEQYDEDGNPIGQGEEQYDEDGNQIGVMVEEELYDEEGNRYVGGARQDEDQGADTLSEMGDGGNAVEQDEESQEEDEEDRSPRQFVKNTFCPTGEGGGIDSSCGGEGTSPRVRPDGSPVKDTPDSISARRGIKVGSVVGAFYVDMHGKTERIGGRVLGFVKNPKNGISKSEGDVCMRDARDPSRILFIDSKNVRLRGSGPSSRLRQNQRQTIPDCYLTKNEEDNLRKLPDLSEQEPVEGAMMTNAFCPTGEGGGQDNSCGSSSKSLRYSEFMSQGHTEKEWDQYRDQQRNLGFERAHQRTIADWHSGKEMPGSSLAQTMLEKGVKLDDPQQWQDLQHDDTVVSKTSVEGRMNRQRAKKLHAEISKKMNGILPTQNHQSFIIHSAAGDQVGMKTAKGYSVVWPDLDSNTDLGKAQVAATKVQAMATYVSGNVESVMPLMDFYTKILGMTDEEAKDLVKSAEEMQAQQQMDQQQQQMMGGQFGNEQQPGQFSQDGMPGQEDQFQSSEEQDGESSFPPTEQA